GIRELGTWGRHSCLPNHGRQECLPHTFSCTVLLGPFRRARLPPASRSVLQPRRRPNSTAASPLGEAAGAPRPCGRRLRASRPTGAGGTGACWDTRGCPPAPAASTSPGPTVAPPTPARLRPPPDQRS